MARGRRLERQSAVLGIREVEHELPVVGLRTTALDRASLLVVDIHVAAAAIGLDGVVDDQLLAEGVGEDQVLRFGIAPQADHQPARLFLPARIGGERSAQPLHRHRGVPRVTVGVPQVFEPPQATVWGALDRRATMEDPDRPRAGLGQHGAEHLFAGRRRVGSTCGVSRHQGREERQDEEGDACAGMVHRCGSLWQKEGRAPYHL